MQSSNQRYKSQNFMTSCIILSVDILTHPPANLIKFGDTVLLIKYLKIYYNIQCNKVLPPL